VGKAAIVLVTIIVEVSIFERERTSNLTTKRGTYYVLPQGEFQSHRAIPLPIPQAPARNWLSKSQKEEKNTAPPALSEFRTLAISNYNRTTRPEIRTAPRRPDGAAELAATRLGRSGDYKNGRLDSWLNLAY
jgi:hypothetical protein